MDSAEYLLNNMKKFVGNDYVPTFDEICRCRIRTLGIKHEEFVFNKVMFRVYDVGGQRSERRKWFENLIIAEQSYMLHHWLDTVKLYLKIIKQIVY